MGPRHPYRRVLSEDEETQFRSVLEEQKSSLLPHYSMATARAWEKAEGMQSQAAPRSSLLLLLKYLRANTAQVDGSVR